MVLESFTIGDKVRQNLVLCVADNASFHALRGKSCKEDLLQLYISLIAKVLSRVSPEYCKCSTLFVVDLYFSGFCAILLQQSRPTILEMLDGWKYHGLQLAGIISNRKTFYYVAIKIFQRYPMFYLISPLLYFKRYLSNLPIQSRADKSIKFHIDFRICQLSSGFRI